MKDNISDMLTRIRNGQKAKIAEITLFWPTPKICIKILQILQKEGYIRGYKKVFLNDKESILVLLKYSLTQEPLIKKINRISKTGQRLYIKSSVLWKGNLGRGIYILSTPKGIISDNDARILNVGGEVLAYIE